MDEALGKKQLIFFGLSCFVGLIIFVTRTKFSENMAGVFYISGVLLLIGLFPFGKEILGQKNWYKFGSFTMQPVEFAKIGTALMLANYVSGPDFNLKYKKSLWTSLIIIGVPAVVVLAIPDVGSLLVFGAYFMALYREGLSGWVFGVIRIFAAIFLVSLFHLYMLQSLFWQSLPSMSFLICTEFLGMSFPSLPSLGPRWFYAVWLLHRQPY
jgi:rod shape determining protein RodA